MNYDQLADVILESIEGIKAIKLPYALDALEPSIDAETMNLHFNKHYKGYVKKLNAALPATNKQDLLSIVKKAKSKKDAIRNNAGGAYNHQLFWNMMSPDRKTISGPIRELIEKQYKSFDNFKAIFVEEALAHFGSGWLWLVKKGNKLELIPTNNQDNPLMYSDVTILLGIDVWEHAYYKKYGPNREKYIKQFLKIVNWDYCNLQLMQ
jgi:Fe-Mn family superoxide dismutase|tara:strand:- start:2070 stop:2693 length:624 start_codon:yes stop_codon:yes gene_type:complete